MKLVNTSRATPTNIPLLCVCSGRGAMLTIPPLRSPLDKVDE
ncbi:MAG TPA: hypothetical protein VGL62_07985 [Vicinamibacterales bacterium]|jgi:hypothetical protein